MDLILDALVGQKVKHVKQLMKTYICYQNDYTKKFKEASNRKTEEFAKAYNLLVSWNYNTKGSKCPFALPKFTTPLYHNYEDNNPNSRIKLKENLKKNVNNDAADFLKSQPIPQNNDGPVKVAVANNFEEIVYKNGRDTLLQFYAPWCMHCKSLAPVYEELAIKMKDEDVEIVKIDATNNDIPKTYEVHFYPSLYWLPKNMKHEPIKYKGGRKLEDFITYIAKNSTNELNGYDRSGQPKNKKT